MNIPPSFSTLDGPCEQALSWAKDQLSKANLHSMQTFDLRAAQHTPENCGCPHHGTKQCDCQMIILLVYENTGDPATLILHGSGGRTWISIADSPPQRANAKLISSIQQALEIKIDISVPS